MYSVRYEDFLGDNNGIREYETEEAAEKAIEDWLNAFKIEFRSLNLEWRDFGFKTEIWNTDGDEYAIWERMWISEKVDFEPGELFGMACSGNISMLRECKEKGCDLDVRYSSFGEEHSLIMGAFRNEEYRTAEWLLTVGCTLTDREQSEINKMYQKDFLIGKMQTVKK